MNGLSLSVWNSVCCSDFSVADSSPDIPGCYCSTAAVQQMAVCCRCPVSYLDFPVSGRGQDGNHCRGGRSDVGLVVTVCRVIRNENRGCRCRCATRDDEEVGPAGPVTGLCFPLSILRSIPGVGEHRSSADVRAGNGSVRPCTPDIPLVDCNRSGSGCKWYTPVRTSRKSSISRDGKSKWQPETKHTASRRG